MFQNVLNRDCKFLSWFQPFTSVKMPRITIVLQNVINAIVVRMAEKEEDRTYKIKHKKKEILAICIRQEN